MEGEGGTWGNALIAGSASGVRRAQIDITDLEVSLQALKSPHSHGGGRRGRSGHHFASVCVLVFFFSDTECLRLLPWQFRPSISIMRPPGICSFPTHQRLCGRYGVPQGITCLDLMAPLLVVAIFHLLFHTHHHGLV